MGAVPDVATMGGAGSFGPMPMTTPPMTPMGAPGAPQTTMPPKRESDVASGGVREEKRRRIAPTPVTNAAERSAVEKQ